MKNVSALTLLAILSACSDSSFKGDVGTAGSVSEKKPEVENFEPAVSTDQPPVPVLVPAPPQASNTQTSPPAGPQAADQLTLACQTAGASLKVLEQSISYAERKGCNFGVAPNLAARDTFLQAAENSIQNLNLPSGTICDIGIESAKGATLRYDDMLVLHLDNFAIFVSTAALLPFMQQKDGIYIWDFTKAVGQKPAEFGGKSFCIGDAEDCIIPDTDQTGPVAISLSNSKIAPIALAIAGKSSVPLTLTALGDNDETDCSQTQLDLKVTFKYLP